MMTFPLALVVLTATLSPLEEPPPAPVYLRVDKLDPDDRFAFDWAGLDLDGNPVAVDRLAYVFVPVVDGPITPPERQLSAVSGSVSAGTTTHLVADICAAVTPGRYRLYVQLRSAAGLWGGFSPELLIEVVSGVVTPPPSAGRAPQAPTALRLEKREAQP